MEKENGITFKELFKRVEKLAPYYGVPMEVRISVADYMEDKSFATYDEFAKWVKEEFVDANGILKDGLVYPNGIIHYVFHDFGKIIVHEDSMSYFIQEAN